MGGSAHNDTPRRVGEGGRELLEGHELARDAIERLSVAVSGLGVRGADLDTELSKLEQVAGTANATCTAIGIYIAPLDMRSAETALVVIPLLATRVRSKIVQARSGRIMPSSELRGLVADLRENYLRSALGILQIAFDLAQMIPAQEGEP